MLGIIRCFLMIALISVPTQALFDNWLSLSNNPVFGGVLSYVKDQCRYIEPSTIAVEVKKTLSDPLYGLVGRALVISQLRALLSHHFQKGQSLPLVLMLTGQPGTGKTFTARLIRDTVFHTPNGGGGEKWGFVEFIASDYIHEGFFTNIFVPRLLAARARCNDRAPVMVFLDEVLKIGNTDSSDKVSAVVRDALKEGKISLPGGRHLDVRKWVFIMATDINAQSAGGKKLQDFLFMHRETDPADPAYRRGLDGVMATLQDDQRQAALFQAFDVQKVLVSGNVVVYAPYEKAEIAHIMQAMVNAFLRDMGLEGQLFLSPTLTTFMKEKLVLEQMAISKDDLCSGASSLWSASKEKSCEPFQVVQDGAASIRQMVQQYLERPVLEVLEAMLEHEQSIEKNREIHMKSILHSRTVSNLQYNKNVHLVVGLVPMDMEADSDAERGFTFRICKIPPMPIDARYEHSPLVADTTMRARVQESMDQCPGDQITDYAGLQLFYYDV